jgi:hypothetical protein
LGLWSDRRIGCGSGHSGRPASAGQDLSKSVGKQIALENERKTMLLLFSPFLASALYIGGGSVGLLLVIVVVVLLLRR